MFVRNHEQRHWLGVDWSRAETAMQRAGNGAELVRVHDGALLARRCLARAITDEQLGVEP